MAGTVTNNMTALNNCENAGDWSDGGEAAYSGFPREGTNCIGNQASLGSLETYDTITSRNMSGETVHMWMWAHASPDTAANVGFGIILGDGTDRAAFQVGGSDLAGFATTPSGWSCYIVSVPDKDDSTAINLAGTTANITDTAITQIGPYFDMTSKALGNVDNVFWDVIWVYTHSGYALELSAGTSGSPAVFSDLATWDASTATNRATGAFYEIASGVFTQQAPIQIGDDGTGSSYFSATNEEVIFSDIQNINNHKFTVVGNSTGTNEAYFTSVTFRNAHTTLTPSLTFNGGNIDNLEFDGCLFLGIDATFSNSADATGHSVDNSTFDGCAQIDPGDVPFNIVTFASTSDANGGLVIDADGTANLTNLTFISDGTGHGAQFTAAGSFDLSNWTWTGYGANDTADAAILNAQSATLVDSYPESNQDLDEDIGVIGTYFQGIGQSFPASAGVLSRVRFYLKKTGSPTGNATAKLYAHSGTYGTSSVPTGAALATSEDFDVSTLSTSYALVDFEFSDRYSLVAATNYVVAVEYDGGSTINYVSVGVDVSSPSHGGNLSRFTDGSGWSAVSSEDACFYVYRGAEVILNKTGGTTPTYRNTGSPRGVTIVKESVTVSFEAVDKDDAAISGVQVSAYAVDNDEEIILQDTNVSGIASATYNGATPRDIYYRYRKSSTGATKYVNISGFATIAADTGSTVKRNMREDDIADPTI